MKSFFSRLLPLLFIVMLSLQPMNAQAASYSIGSGMFDCLGELDWGCRIIGFLFETTDRGNDNSVTYVKDGTTVTEQPTALMGALRGMMAFFSNALLIVASIKLLYELIQMTAESAQTGQVGGKDANKLWAPIRLVIAIGLLVPLESGLNSGQYIVLQIAKWGSGLASQGWKVFVEKLSDGESLTTATAPRIRSLAINTFRSYACMEFVNDYANKLKLSYEVVTPVQTTTSGGTHVTFKNGIHNNVCGSIRYNSPATSTGNTKEDARISQELSQGNRSDFMTTEGDLNAEATYWAQMFMPESRTEETPSFATLDNIIDTFQNKMKERIENKKTYAATAMAKITEQIQSAANTQGWTSAGSWFLAITRAQGQIINGAANIPEATGPNMQVLVNYKDAYDNYINFEEHLKRGKQYSAQGNALLPIGSTDVGSSTEEERGWGDAILDWPADALFGFLDWSAKMVGLWDTDPRKAFGDLGGTTNPFAEIAALGHRKIYLALRLVGWAAGSSIVSLATNMLARSIDLKSALTKAPFGRQAYATASGISSGLTAILMMLATLFFLAGVLLAYIVPLFPFTRFFFSILTWLGSLFEAMVLVPMMALAFLTPKGEGFAGPNTKNAFFLLFQLFLRPILCVFGLMCAMLIFYVAAKFLNASFYEATSGIGVYHGTGMRFMQKLVYSVMYVGLIYSAANISFKMIEHFPTHAMKWMGGSASEHSYDDHNAFMGIATAVGGQQLLSNFQSLPEKLMAPAVKGYDERKAHNDAALAKYRHNQLENATRGGDAFRDPIKPSATHGPASSMVTAAVMNDIPEDADTAIDFRQAMSGVHNSSGIDTVEQATTVSGAIRAHLRDKPGDVLGAMSVGTAINAYLKTTSGGAAAVNIAKNAGQAIAGVNANGAIQSPKQETEVIKAINASLQSNPTDISLATAAGIAARNATTP